MPDLVHEEKRRRAVFLDRDGTINIEKDYLVLPQDFAFHSGVTTAIKRLRDAGFLVIVVTNQSGVARGMFDEQDVARLHDYVQAELAKHDTRIDAFYHCPHHPTHGIDQYRRECDCRKGAPGMLIQAAADFSLDLAGSYMVGDKISDIEAGNRAGCLSILVKTGYGAHEMSKLPPGIPVVEDLPAAANLILHREKQLRH